MKKDEYENLVSYFRSISIMIMMNRAFIKPEIYKSLWGYVDHIIRMFSDLRLKDTAIID